MTLENLIKIEHFCQSHEIDIEFINALNDHGLLQIIVVEDSAYLTAEQLPSAEKMIRLHFNLNINIEGIDAILHLLDRIDSLQSQLTLAQNKLSFYKYTSKLD